MSPSGPRPVGSGRCRWAGAWAQWAGLSGRSRPGSAIAVRRTAPKSDTETLDGVRTALAWAPRLDLRAQPFDLAAEEGSLTMVGAVASVAAKKSVLEAAAAAPGAGDIVDRLQVESAQVEQELPLFEQELDVERRVGKTVV